MSNASSTYYSPEVTDALYKYIVYRIRRILYLPQSIWEYQCPPLALEIAQLSSYSFSIWSTFHLGFEQRKRRILKRTSFKVVIPEHVLKDLDAKNESRLVRCPGTFKVHLSLMQWKPDNMFFFCVLRGWPRKSHCVVSAQNLPNAVTWWPNNFWQEAVWTELQHHAEARAVPLGFRRENQFCLSCLLSCWETKYTYAVCGNDMLIYCIDSYASLRLIRLIQLCHTPVIFCWGVNFWEEWHELWKAL